MVKQWREKIFNSTLKSAIKIGDPEDCVLLLLGSPDYLHYPSDVDASNPSFNEEWNYELNPVGSAIIRFYNHKVISVQLCYDQEPPYEGKAAKQ